MEKVGKVRLLLHETDSLQQFYTLTFQFCEQYKLIHAIGPRSSGNLWLATDDKGAGYAVKIFSNEFTLDGQREVAHLKTVSDREGLEKLREVHSSPTK